tara:strand:- start:406 stop:684 length:279 start_codon:yes stop_codon:yes gene_type:complete
MPLYKHNCDKCTCIGSYKLKSDEGDKQTEDGVKYFDVDVYMCSTKGDKISMKDMKQASVLVRYSDEPSDETWSPFFMWIGYLLADYNISLLN